MLYQAEGQIKLEVSPRSVDSDPDDSLNHYYDLGCQKNDSFSFLEFHFSLKIQHEILSAALAVG